MEMRNLHHSRNMSLRCIINRFVLLYALACLPLAAARSGAQNYVYFSQFGGGILNRPAGIAIQASRNILVVDAGTSTVDVFDSQGNFSQAFGGYNTDPGPYFNSPRGVFIDPLGNIFVGDSNNSRVDVWYSNYQYNTFFGDIGMGNGKFEFPLGIALDSLGYYLVTDTNNNRVQVWTWTGADYQWVMNFGGGYVTRPAGIAVDVSGNIYVVDAGNGRVQVLNASYNYIRTIGGYGSGPGQMIEPRGIAIDSNGNIFVTDAGNNRVEEFDSSGQFITQFGTSGNGNGQFSFPYAIAIDSAGKLLVADTNNGRVQVFVPLSVTTHDPNAKDPYTAPHKDPLMSPSIWRYNGWGVNPIKTIGRQRLLLQIHTLPNQKVKVWVQPDPNSGGHVHATAQNGASRPFGFLSATKLGKNFPPDGDTREGDTTYHDYASGLMVTARSTDGIALVWYTASEIGGTENVWVSTTENDPNPGALASQAITLQVPNLTPFIGANYGLTNDHPVNWFAAPTLNTKLQAATTQYQQAQGSDTTLAGYLNKLAGYGGPNTFASGSGVNCPYDFPSNPPSGFSRGGFDLPQSPETLYINDISLQNGGLFDVDGHWDTSGGHFGHRTGSHADIGSAYLYSGSPYDLKGFGGQNETPQTGYRLPGGGWAGNGWKNTVKDPRLVNPKPNAQFGNKTTYTDPSGIVHHYDATTRAAMQTLVQQAHYRRLELLLNALWSQGGAVFVPEPGQPHIHVQFD